MVVVLTEAAEVSVPVVELAVKELVVLVRVLLLDVFVFV
jgi:hypothetical protein